MGHRTGCCSLADRCKSPVAIRPRSLWLPQRKASLGKGRGRTRLVRTRGDGRGRVVPPVARSDLHPSRRSGLQWLATDHIDPLAEHAQPDGERDQEHAEDNGVATDQPGQRQRAGAWLLCQRQRVADTDAYGGRA